MTEKELKDQLNNLQNEFNNLDIVKEYRKKFQAAQDLVNEAIDNEREVQNLKLLEECKQKYKYTTSYDQSVKLIDWVKVEEQLKAGLKDNTACISFNDTGDQGLAIDYGMGGYFEVFLESEDDCRKYHERKKRLKEK
jgi:hypothetical protein